MKRDTIAFIAITLFIAFMVGTFTLIIAQILGLMTGFYVVKAVWKHRSVLGDTLNNAGAPTQPNTYTMTIRTLPRDFVMMMQCIYNTTSQPGDTLQAWTGRLLKIFNVGNGGAVWPDYFYNVLANKVLWEYVRKFGTSRIEVGKGGTLVIDEILQPVPDADRSNFHQFCLQQTLAVQ